MDAVGVGAGGGAAPELDEGIAFGITGISLSSLYRASSNDLFLPPAAISDIPLTAAGLLGAAEIDGTSGVGTEGGWKEEGDSE